MIAVIVLRSTLLLAVGAIVVAARRQSSASERHLLWMLTLSAMLLLPIAMVRLPSLSIIPVPSALVPVATGSTEALPSEPDVHRSKSELVWLIWIAGAIVCFSRISVAHVRARRIVREAIHTDALSRTAGSPVYLSDDAATAFSYGLTGPVIVLPAQAEAWSSDQLHATLLHETAHISRRDGISLCIAQCAVALYWWHPAVWFIARKAAAERERAADDAVLRTGVRPSEYGSHLLGQATGGGWMPRLAATGFLHHSNGLAPRIASILNTRVDRRPVSRGKAVLAWTAALPVIAFIAAAAPAYSRLPIAVGSPAVSLRAVAVIAQRPVTKPETDRKSTRDTKRVTSRKRNKPNTISAVASDQVLNGDERSVLPLIAPMRLFPRLAVQMARLASSLADTSKLSR